MAAELIFDIDRVRELYEHSRSCAKHDPSYGQRAQLYGDEVRDQQPDEQDRCPPGLLFVKEDDGIYLKSNGVPGLMEDTGESGVTKPKVCYARGYDPDKDEDVVERARAAAGGDDFTDVIGEYVLDSCMRAHHTTEFIIHLEKENDETMRFSVSRRKRHAGRKPDPLSIEALSAKLAEGRDINEPVNDDGETALCQAAREGGKQDVIAWLLKNGADPDKPDNYSNTPLIWAVRKGDTALVRFLISNNVDIDAGSADDNTALFYAVADKEPAPIGVLQALIAGNADLAVLNKLNMTGLHMAAFAGNCPAIEALLDAGADVNTRTPEGKTPLFCAISDGKTAGLKLLIEKGADVNVRDEHGKTPLFYACKAGRVDIVKELLESGADIDICDSEGKSILHMAAETDDRSILSELLQRSDNIDATDRTGRTPLRLAIEKGYEAHIVMMLEEGASLNVPDKENITPLTLVFKNHIERGRAKLVPKLMAHGFIDGNSARHAISLCYSMYVTPPQSRKRRYLLANVRKAGIDLCGTAVEKHGDTILHSICRSNSIAGKDITEALRTGVDVNAINKTGETALIALMKRTGPPPRITHIKGLIDAGADVTVVDKSGNDAKSLAGQLELDNIDALLDKAQAQAIKQAPAAKNVGEEDLPLAYKA